MVIQILPEVFFPPTLRFGIAFNVPLSPPIYNETTSKMWISYQVLYSKCTSGQLPNSSHPLWVGLLHPPRADDWNWAADQRCIQNKNNVKGN